MSYSFGENPVWERSGPDELSDRTYVVAFFGATIFGLLVTAAVSYFAVHNLDLIHQMVNWPKWQVWALLIGVMVAMFAGIFIALGSDHPVVSLFGYLLVAGPFGLLLGPTLMTYDSDIVVKACATTALVVVVLSVIGVIYPKSLEGWGVWLFGGLSILLVGFIGIPVLRMLGVPVGDSTLRIFDWFGIVLFSAYVIFDTNRAMHVRKTWDNAIDCAVALYLDIINLLLLILREYARAKKA